MRSSFAAALLATTLIGSAASAQTVTIARSVDSPNYDPHRNSASATGDSLYMLGDTLVSLDWDQTTVKPGLAESWTVSPDGKTYTFKLRQDVTFCSGKKFTAEDAIYTLKRAVDPQLKSPWAWRQGKIKELRAPDPYTLEYELESPESELLNQLTQYQATIINKENVEALGKDFGTKGFDGTGPYCWQSWEPRSTLIMTRHEAYKWGPPIYQNRGPAKIQKVIWKVIPEESTMVAALLSGQADMSYTLPFWAINQLKVAPNLQASRPEKYFRIVYNGFKSDRPMVSDVRVRKALNLAVDRKELVDALFFGEATPATTFVRPGVRDFNPETESILAKYDPAEAGRLLDEAGWKMGADGFRAKDGKRLAPQLYGIVGYASKMNEAIQGYYRKIGVDLQIQMFDSTIAYAKLATQEYDIWSISFPYMSAGEMVSTYFSSANVPTPNRANWKDEETDREIAAAHAALTDADRALHYGKAQMRVTEQALWLPIAHAEMTLVATKKLKGVRAHGIYLCGTYKMLDTSY